MTKENNLPKLSTLNRFEDLETLVHEAVKKYGHFVQAVSGSIWYTIGLALDEGYELIAFNHNKGWDGFDAMMLNSTLEGKTPAHHAVYTAERYTVTVNGEEQASRYGFIEIKDHELLQLLTERGCYGWRTLFFETKKGQQNIDSLLKSVYWAVASDKNNIMPWEPGYNGIQQSLTVLQPFLEARENIFKKERHA